MLTCTLDCVCVCVCVCMCACACGTVDAFIECERHHQHISFLGDSARCCATVCEMIIGPDMNSGEDEALIERVRTMLSDGRADEHPVAAVCVKH